MVRVSKDRAPAGKKVLEAKNKEKLKTSINYKTGMRRTPGTKGIHKTHRLFATQYAKAKPIAEKGRGELQIGGSRQRLGSETGGRVTKHTPFQVESWDKFLGKEMEGEIPFYWEEKTGRAGTIAGGGGVREQKIGESKNHHQNQGLFVQTEIAELFLSKRGERKKPWTGTGGINHVQANPAKEKAHRRQKPKRYAQEPREKKEGL